MFGLNTIAAPVKVAGPPLAVRVADALEEALEDGRLVPLEIKAPLPPGYWEPGAPTKSPGTTLWFEA